MPRPRPLFTVLAFCVLLAPPAAAQQVGVNWQQDIESAKALAKQSNRLVLIHFWTPTCGPCMMLNQNVFNQPGVATALDSQFVPVKLNANENSATAMGYGITRVPTDVIITPEGEVVGQLISPPTPSAYISEVSQIASRFATRSGQTFANAAAAAPLPATPQHFNSEYANLPVSANTPAVMAVATNMLAGNGGTPVTGVTTNFAAPPVGGVPQTSVPGGNYAGQPQPSIGRYASNPATGQTPPMVDMNSAPAAAAPSAPSFSAPPLTQSPPLSPAPPAIVANRYVTEPAHVSPAAPIAPTVQAQGVTPAAPVAAAPAQIANPYASYAPPTPTLPVVPAIQQASSAYAANIPYVAAQPPAIQPPAAPAAPTSPVASAAPAGVPDVSKLPPGAAPLGFDGYCPVSMRNSNLTKWVPGDPRYGVIHRGRTYWFAGPQEQKQFWENPDHYTPALSGIDPVLAMDHKQQVPGKREHSLDYDNLFYLFASEATLQQFAANPERYASGIRQAMGISRGRMVR